jgi:hypothetical protein
MITGDKFSIFVRPQPKRESVERKSNSSGGERRGWRERERERERENRLDKSVCKVKLQVFFDAQCFVKHEFISDGWTAKKKRTMKLYVVSKKKLKTKTPWPESASELYRQSDRRLSAKLVPT